MNSENNDGLWRLLGRAKTPEVSPFFSRNVLREIRADDQERHSPLARAMGWIVGPARWPAIGGVILLVCFSLLGINQREQQNAGNASAREQSKQEMVLAQQLAKNPDSEVIKHLDELLVFEDNAVWPDSQAK